MQANSTNIDNSQPLISFIITVYNIPVDMIRECLDSVISLSLRENEREIILVDDGSDISPLTELTQYDGKITYIRQPNKGLSEARNIGMDICHGQYIQFIDADDYLITNTYNHCLDILRFNDTEMVVFSPSSKPEASLPKDEPITMSGSQYMKERNLRPMAWGYIFRKSILHDLRFRKNLLHEDEEFTPRLVLRCEHLTYTTAQAYYYRKRSNSITTAKDKIVVKNRLDATEEILLRLKDMTASLPLEERLALERRVAQLSMDYIYNIIRNTHSMNELSERVKRMESNDLYPLPKKNYTYKYKVFSTLANTRFGLRLLNTLIR